MRLPITFGSTTGGTSRATDIEHRKYKESRTLLKASVQRGKRLFYGLHSTEEIQETLRGIQAPGVQRSGPRGI